MWENHHYSLAHRFSRCVVSSSAVVSWSRTENFSVRSCPACRKNSVHFVVIWCYVCFFFLFSRTNKKIIKINRKFYWKKYRYIMKHWIEECTREFNQIQTKINEFSQTKQEEKFCEAQCEKRCWWRADAHDTTGWTTKKSGKMWKRTILRMLVLTKSYRVSSRQIHLIYMHAFFLVHEQVGEKQSQCLSR